MLFNSIEFAIFLSIVFCLYWFVFQNKLKFQNVLILASSYLFYGWWDFRFLSLIIFSTLVDYSIGAALYKNNDTRTRKRLLGISIITNLGLLGVFKYYNFFLDNFITVFTLFGKELNYQPLNIILPVGISFYTFQTMSYTIDIYKRKITPTNDLLSFAAFVSFFPQLVAGPIERASNLLPQILHARKFHLYQAIDGIKLIAVGLFRKVVIADNLSVYVDHAWENLEYAGSTVLWLSSIFFSIQIYMDFSGYSRIARGVAKLFGIELMLNFHFPYTSRSIGEFWGRWHISLSTWFKDYVYIPLGGNRRGKLRLYRNLLLVFLLSGFWHGASWNFVIWGFIHFLILAIESIISANRRRATTSKLLSIIYVCFTVNLAWIFFRSPDIFSSWEYLRGMFINNNPNDFTNLSNSAGPIKLAFYLLLIPITHLIMKIEIQSKDYSLNKTVALITTLSVMIYFLMEKGNQFIYFQF